MLEARRIAHTVLVRVDCDEAFANRSLDAALRSAGRLDPRDVALATELSYGSLRKQVHLDHVLGLFSKRPLNQLDPETRALLRLGAYQILHTRIPSRASVHTTVELAKEFKKGRASGFVNGVLRALLRKKDDIQLPSLEKDPVQHISLSLAFPPWLVRESIRWFGLDRAHSLLKSLDSTAALSLRVNRLKMSREEAVKLLETHEFSCQPAPHSPHGLYLPQARTTQELLRPEHGGWQAQDEAAQLVGYFAAPRPGDTVLDACAAPGGKTCHLAELMDNKGHIDAVDVHRNKLDAIAEGASRLGLSIVHPHAADASKALPFAAKVMESQEGYDLALIDAPCSGLGILRRHPELKTRRTSQDISRLAKLQGSILRKVARHVRPSGVLVYAVCTITPEEGPEQIDAFLKANPQWKRQMPPQAASTSKQDPESAQNSADVPTAPRDEQAAPSTSWPQWSKLLDSRGDLVLAPDTHGTDGFYAARLVRSDTP